MYIFYIYFVGTPVKRKFQERPCRCFIRQIVDESPSDMSDTMTRYVSLYGYLSVSWDRKVCLVSEILM
jgi:hypothetical protein